MRILMLLGLPVFFPSLVTLAQLPEPVNRRLGSIEGSVTNAGGKPISGAKVSAFPLSRNPTGRLRSTITDDTGKFRIDELAPGEYVVYSAKEAENYADSMTLMSSSKGRAPKVRVQAQQVAGVQIRRTRKAGVLEGQVLDADRGAAIPSAGIRIYRPEDPKEFFSAGTNLPEGRFRVLVGAEAVRIEVSAEGYHSWHYGKDGSKARSEVLQLAPETTKRLTVRLRAIK